MCIRDRLNRVSCFNYAPEFLQLIVNAQQHFRNVAQFGQFSPAALTPSLWLSRLPLWKQSRPWHLRGKPGQGLAVVRIHWLAIIARRFEIGNAIQSGVSLACGEIGGIAVAPGQAAPFAAFFCFPHRISAAIQVWSCWVRHIGRGGGRSVVLRLRVHFA